ncbi:hypothetical protein B0H19DRAFT_939602, partial [Mycena capillaripes]
CQLDNLSTYVKGVGLEPLEDCESFFSKSNALASTTRYASRFHRQQAITTYMKHTNTFDTYQNLCKSSVSNPATNLRVARKEKAHLQTLLKEPLRETLEMDYYQKLVNLREIEYIFYFAAQATRRIETQRHHALEQQSKALDMVQDLELRLGISARWVEGDDGWVAAAALVRRRRYQCALDNLEGLIIARIFELSKCHMSETGKPANAITAYNAAANTMTPPMLTLDWEQVVEYAFLSDFDLLRESQEDIRQEAWALPSGRAAMDQHFKLLCATEEIH